MPTSEPAASPAGPGSLPTGPGERRALWLATAGLIALCVGQAPGRIVPETKLDVVVAPAQFLGRALRAWDPLASFGRLQNQAVGYLFPMGPFSAGGKAVGLPPWLTQRLWIASLLVAGLWGAHRVARAIGIGSSGGRVAAGLAYTISPATMAVVAFQSAGQVPYALAPWVLVPLIEADRFRSPRRAAAWSALAVAAMGGVNGAATLAVLPLAVLWFCTRAPGPERRRLAAWWAGSVALAIAWWLAALAIYVRYGVRFTSYTENAATTTSTESVLEVLRGTGNWLGYLNSEHTQWLPGAWSMISSRLAIVGSTLVAALGLGGLARSDAPARRWLVPTAVLGAVAIGVGHAGVLGGGFGGAFRALLDGPLAPFRNVQKFAPVLRVPLALGLGHAVTVAGRILHGRGRRITGRVPAQALVASGAVALVVLAILPAIPGRVVAPGSFPGIPRYWTEATHWLDRHDRGGGRALLEPGEPFGEYVWGRPLDEPLSEGTGEWAVRDLIPLGGDGSSRVLDALDRALASDQVPAGFVPTLGRMGVRYLVVRNDLDPARRTGPGPAQIHRALSTAPSLRRVAAFGPDESDGSVPPAALTGAGVPDRWPAVEVFAVPHSSPRVVAYPVRGSIVASGGPEGIVQATPGDLAGRGYVLDADVPPGVRLDGAIAASTDTARRRDVTFGAVRDNASYTLAAHEDAAGSTKAPQDRLGFTPDHHLTVSTTLGATAVTASSFPNGTGAQPENQPYAAFDGDPSTSWVPGKAPLGQWVQVQFGPARRLGRVTVTVPTNGIARVDAVRVTTDRGSTTVAVPASGRASVATAGTTTRLRVTITGSTRAQSVSGPGITDVTARGLAVFRPLATPTDRPAGVGRAAAEVAWLSRSSSDPYADAGDEDIRLDRIVRLDQPGARSIGGTGSARPGPTLDRLFTKLTKTSAAPQAAATTTWHDIPALGPRSAVDGDPATSWMSALNDDDPTLTVLWPESRTIHEVRLVRAGPSVEPLRQVTITTLAGSGTYRVPPSGRIHLPSQRTDRITIEFPGQRTKQVGLSEVEVPPFRPAPPLGTAADVHLPCGSGPALRIDGRSVRTRATASVAALAGLAPVSWASCGPVPLTAGSHRIEGSADDEPGPLRIDTLRLAPARGLPAAGPSRTVRIERWAAEHRRVEIGPGGAALLATTENANAGWHATLDGRPLTAIRVDGWRQGWLVPAGRGGAVTLTYGPGRTQRLALAGGAGLVVLLVGLALLPRRRRARPGGAPAGAASAVAGIERAWAAPWIIGVGLVAGVLLGGWLVVLVAPAGCLAATRRRWVPCVAGGCVLAAGVVTLVQAGALSGSGRGTFSATAQVFGVLAVLLLASSALPDPPAWWPRRRPEATDPAVPD